MQNAACCRQHRRHLKNLCREGAVVSSDRFGGLGCLRLGYDPLCTVPCLEGLGATTRTIGHPSEYSSNQSEICHRSKLCGQVCGDLSGVGGGAASLQIRAKLSLERPRGCSWANHFGRRPGRSACLPLPSARALTLQVSIRSLRSRGFLF